ncbi:MAG: hypothetical protein Hens2KO_10540 [Henriciella sp.]
MLNDYQKIQNLIGSYGQIVDAWPRQPQRYADHFTEDGGFTDNGVTITPRHKILQLMKTAVAHEKDQSVLSGTKHLQLNPVIMIDGDTGTGSVDLVVLELSEELGWQVRGCGRYSDEYAKGRDGTWRFKSREVTWHKDLGPDPCNPGLATAYAGFFKAIMS